MNDEIESFGDYWQEVQETALIELEETEEHVEREEMELTRAELIESASDYAVDACDLVRNNWKTVIYFTDNGFDGIGYDRYIRHREFPDNDPREMVKALAQAAYYNDVRDVIEEIFDVRDSLGEAKKLIDEYVYSEGVEVEYVYAKNTMREMEHYEFRLEHLGACEWRMYDPEGNAFEVISPKIHVTESDDPIAERALWVWLNNICARRLRELDDE